MQRIDQTRVRGGTSYTTIYDITDMFVMIYEGKIYFHGTPKELVETKDKIIRTFLYRTDKRL